MVARDTAKVTENVIPSYVSQNDINLEIIVLFQLRNGITAKQHVFSKGSASAFQNIAIIITILLAPMFLNLFSTSSQIHSYDTRIAKCYRPHHRRTNLKQFTILFQCSKIWNSLPESITGSSSFSSFKKKMIKFLIKWFWNWLSCTFTAKFLIANPRWPPP